MAVSPKIIYLETDEEITSIVDKLRKTEFKKVVLVVPKEAGLLGSVVNLKLLKRQAENLEKSIAIVTHDKVGRALAEKIGILASAKLEDVANENEFVPVPLEETKENYQEEQSRAKRSEGPLAETNEVIYKKDSKKTITEDDEPIIVKEESEVEPEFNKKEIEESEITENLMPKLPMKKTLIAVGIVSFVLLVAGFFYIPRARATILVKAERKAVSIDFTGAKDAKLDTEKAIVPVQAIEVTKEANKKFNASGKKNIGAKATGSLRVANLSGQDINWILGTRFVPTSNTSLVFKATSPIYAPDGQVTSIVVEAAEPGDQYNGFGSNQMFTLAATSLSSNVTVTSKDGMTGGSNKEITYVTQGDINSAKESLSKDALEEATTEFNKKVEELKVIDDTKKEEVISANANPGLDAEGNEFTLSLKVKVVALGYNLNDVSQIIKSEVERQLGFVKQVVDDGAKEANVNIESTDLEKGTISGKMQTDAFVSQKIDQDQVKNELIGINAAKAETYLKGLEGVQDTKLEFFPSFLKLFPRIKSHIFVIVQVADRGN